MVKQYKKHFFTSIVALLLVFSLIAVSYGDTMGEVVAYGSTYISEVKVFSGDSLKSAIAKCKSAGYYAVEKNINRDEDGDDDDDGIYVLGYKTTDNPDEGITGISMLQMNNGYQDYTYGDVAEMAMTKLGDLPSELGDAVSEFADNYAEGVPSAVAAVSVLNCFTVDEMDNMPLGDYVVSGQCNVDFIKKLMVRSSTAVVSAFGNALVAGVAEKEEDNWAKRLCENTKIREKLEDDANYATLDRLYKVYATELSESVQEFSVSFHEAEARYYANDNKIELPDTEEKSVTDIPEETVDDMVNGGEIKAEDGDAFVLYAYDVLNTYLFDDNTGLGEYIVSLGDGNYDTIANLRNLYPLVDSLTDGQVAAMRLGGMAFSAIYLINRDGLTEKADEQIKAIIKDLKSQSNSESISIWTGTDQTIYNQKVAVTTASYRANSAGQIYNTLTTPDETDTFLSDAMSKLQIIMGVIGIGYGITTLAGMTIAHMSAFAIGSVGVSASVWAVCCAGIGSGVMSTILGLLGCAFIILNYVALLVMVVLLIAMFAKWIYDMCTDEDDEDFTPIPTVLFDLAQNRYVKYTVVNEGSKPANINGENGRRWNALYVTKSKYVGNPICSGDVEDFIKVQYKDSKTPAGYAAVTCFGEVTAANLNANVKSDADPIYMFTKTTVNEINEGEKQPGTDYLSKISLSVSSSETAAKAALTKAGYKVIDVNLTSVTASDKQYTYLGFQTTTNPDDAITDIRISPRNSAGAFLYGNASYTSCGTTPVGDTLYYTSYESAGVPILADIQVKQSLNDAPEGYEPVNMFCGGNAYNLNVGSEMNSLIFSSSKEQTYEHWSDKGSYLYFKPSVTFTEGTEYISGFVLVAGSQMSKGGNSALDYCEYLGLRELDADLTYGWQAETIYKDSQNYTMYSKWNNVDTLICYTTTHNPYRAIYGVRSYTAAPYNTMLPSSLGSNTTGAYSVCDILFELPYDCNGKQSIERMRRGVYETHSYQFASENGTIAGFRPVSATVQMCPEDDENVKWKYSSIRAKGLYVLGPVIGGTPLTMNDIMVSDKALSPDGFNSVQDFRNPNRSEPHNLAYNAYSSDYRTEKSIPVYMYVRGAAPVEKKYISSITVSSYSIDKLTGGKTDQLDEDTKTKLNKTCNDTCVQNLITLCTDEIIPANLATDYSESYYSDCKTETYRASYVGVSRTDVETEAITGIIRYVTKEDTVPSSIKVGEVEYVKAGDKISDPKGSYYLYYTKSAGANPGKPITDISVTGNVFEPDMATAMSSNCEDIPEKKDGSKVIQEKVIVSAYGDPNSSTFIHMTFEDNTTIMGAIYVGHGKTKKEAQCNLLSLGCNMCIDMDLNHGAGGEYIYIGYTRYKMSSSEKRKNDPKFAVRDIILTVGEAPQSEIMVGTLSYKIAYDEFTSVKNYDGREAVSLNRGTGGKQIYLYYTTTKTDSTKDPVARLGASCRDFAMVNTTDWKWENILDRNGNRVNVNEGAIGTTDDGEHITDNRIYLYASRSGNSVKSGAAVKDGQISTEYSVYDVYMKGVD